MKEERIKFSNREGERLVGILHTSTKKTNKAVVICHGFRANKDIYWMAALARRLCSKGYGVLRFDFCGNGESQGLFVDATYDKEQGDLHSALDHLENMGYSKFALVGHSMGGGVAIMEGALDRRVKTIVDVAGAAHPQLNPQVTRAVLLKIGLDDPDRYLDYLKNVDINRSAANLDIPVLILHGSDDKRIPLSESEELKNTIGIKCELKILSGCDHLFAVMPGVNRLISEVTGWMKKNL